MAPELHLKSLHKGTRVDIFALGVILFLMKCRAPPFKAAIPDDYNFVTLVRNKE
jgi:serine/threonine protein kinase